MPCERPPYFIFNFSLFPVMASTLHAVKKSKLIFRYDNFEACWIIIVHHFHCQNNHLLPLRKKVMGNEILQRQRVVRQGTERGIRVDQREVGGYVGSCCVPVGSGVQTDATIPCNVGTCSASWEGYDL